MDQPQPGPRLLEACNVCRKRKVKCDRQRPSCAQCNKSQTPCTYTDRVKVLKTPRRRPTKAKLLEDRLERMESLLRVPVAMLKKAAEDGSTGITKASQTPRSVSEGIEEPSMTLKNPLQARESASTTPSSLQIEEDSPTETAELSSSARSSHTSHGINSSHISKVLPPRDEAMSLAEMYFSRFNSVIPIFHQETFMKTFRERFDAISDEDAGWWACMNMVIAFGSRLQAFKTINPQDGDEDAWGYIENALSVVPALAVSKPSLISIQALLGMTFFIQATPLSRSYTLLLATAIRFGQSIGLHRREAYNSGLTPTEIEQRKRVFWIGYILDKDISMRSGNPPIQHDDDIDVDFPSNTSKEDPIGYVFLAHGLWPMDFFRLRIQLATIQSYIHNNLYSAKAARQSDDTRRALVHELDEKLRQWKSSTSLDFQPEYLSQVVQHNFDLLHLMILYFTYFNCLTLIHRSSFQNMSWKTRSADSVEPFNPRNFSSKPVVIDAARTALKLLKLLPQKNYSTIWAVLQFSVSAIITLLRNIQLNPSLTTALPDYNLVEPFLGLFCNLVQRLRSASVPTSQGYRQDINQDPSEGGVIVELLRMREFCFALRDCAKLALEAANPTISIWMSGNNAGPRENNPGVSNQQENEALDAEIKNLIQTKAANDPNKSRAAFIQAFETSFHERAKLSGLSAQDFFKHFGRRFPKPNNFPLQTESSAQVEHSSSIVAHIDNEDIANLPVLPSPTVSFYDETGLWNWWELIDMDSDSNNHEFGSTAYR